MSSGSFVMPKHRTIRKGQNRLKKSDWELGIEQQHRRENSGFDVLFISSFPSLRNYLGII